MNILLIPANDWLRQPVPSRHHHIFEIIAETDNVHVLQFDLYPENFSRETHVILHRLHPIPSKDLSSYYILNFVFHSRRIASIVKSEEIDVVVVCNLLPGIPTLLPNLQGRKVIFDFKDMLSDVAAIYYRYGFLSSMIRGASEWLQRRLLQRADHIITVSMFLVQYLKGIRIHDVSLITNGADLSIFKPDLKLDGFNLSLKKKLRDSKIIGFVGTIDRWIDFETVIESLKELSSTIDDVKLLIVGGKSRSDYFDRIRSLVHKTGLQEKVIFTGFVPHNDVPYYINLMDVCLIPMKADLRLNQARCPDKLFEYLACGKPVVSTRLSEVLRIGQDAVRFYDDASSLTSILTDILRDDAFQNFIKKKALDIAKNYEWRSIAERYRRTLEEVSNI